jgi:hypothetical protein
MAAAAAPCTVAAYVMHDCLVLDDRGENESSGTSRSELDEDGVGEMGQGLAMVLLRFDCRLALSFGGTRV